MERQSLFTGKHDAFVVFAKEAIVFTGEMQYTRYFKKCPHYHWCMFNNALSVVESDEFCGG